MDIYQLLAQQGKLPMGLNAHGAVGPPQAGFGQPLPGIGAGQGGAQSTLPAFQTFAPTPNAGMLAQQPQGMPAPDPGGGVLGALDRVFGGPDMENLSPKARRQVRRQGLLTMAAQMLTATDPRGRRAQGLAPIGQAIFAGQQAYGQGIQNAQQADEQARMAEFYGQMQPRAGETPDDTLYRYRQMLTQAAQHPNNPNSKVMISTLGGMIDSLQNQMGRGAGSNFGEAKQYMVDGKPTWLRVDKSTGAWLGENGQAVDFSKVKPMPDAPRPQSPLYILGQNMGIARDVTSQQKTIKDWYDKDAGTATQVSEVVDRALAQAPQAMAGDASAKANLIDSYIRFLNNNKAIREFQVQLFEHMQTLKQSIEGNREKWLNGGSDQLPPSLVEQMVQTLKMGQTDLHTLVENAQERARAQAEDWNRQFPNNTIDINKLLPPIPWKSGSGAGGLTDEQRAAMQRALEGK